MTVAVREIKGAIGVIAKLRNALVDEEHKVTCIPQILKMVEDQN